MWLSAAVQPWCITQARLWHSGGLALDLRSERAGVLVVVEVAGTGLRVAVRGRGRSDHRDALQRALTRALEREPKLRGYLARLTALRNRFDGSDEGSDEFNDAIELWRTWPEHERPRSARAAVTLHRIARGEVLATLREWTALGEPGSSPSFVERHLDALMLGLLGRRDDALDALVQAQASEIDPERWLAIARAYEALDAKDSAIPAHEQVIARRGDKWDFLRLARAGHQLSLDEIPKLAPDASTPERVAFVGELVEVFCETGRFDNALTAIRGLLDGERTDVPDDLLLRAATLHLWRGEHELARECSSALEADPRAKLIEGALACIEGRPKEALEILATIESDGSTRLAQLLWQAEAELALGRADAALDRVDAHIKLANSLAAYLLKFAILAASKPTAELADSIASRTFLDSLVTDVLPSLVEPDRLARAHADPSEFAALIRELLDSMGGNRSSTLTWLRRADDGRRRLERVEARPFGRDAAIRNLMCLRTEPPDQVLADFDAVAAEYPLSPHPWTYRGELLIWLGRYDAALSSFAEADARAPTRWSYVGRAAAYDLLGESEQAEHWTREGITRFGELETATTHVYRGERLRKLGALDAARRDLELAVGSKSGRIGARINLALVYLALGDDVAWRRECDRLCLDAPALLWEVGVREDRALEVEDLHAALSAMVGNRSSFLHTIVDAQGGV